MTVVDESARADDIHEAERLLHRVYPAARLQQSSHPFRYTQQQQGDDAASLVRFQIAPPTRVQADLDGTIAIGHLLGGNYEATSTGTVLDVSAPFLLGPGATVWTSAALDLLMVNLDLGALEVFAATEHGLSSARLRLHGTSPLSPAKTVLWNETVAYARRMFEEPEYLYDGLLRDTGVRMLRTAALSSFPIEIVGSPDSTGREQPLPASIRRAMAYIDEHRAEPIGPHEIAAAARMSVRGLHAAFRQHLGTTPLAAVRAARLDSARHELLAADPSSSDVASIARRWGFAHLGRFAQQYRAEYGERPSDSLRR